LRDNLDALQCRAIKALIESCEQSKPKIIVQISAPGAAETADTQFMRSKAKADAALRASDLDWVIFKPGLVISRNAYGGTALIRMLAGFPGVQPLILPNAKIQTVAIEDVVDAVSAALCGRIGMRQDYDLVEDRPHSLAEIVGKFRVWMGFNKDAPRVILPGAFGFVIAKIADVAGWFGWRSPMRSTAIRVLGKNILGDPEPWRSATGRSLQSLDETLARSSASLQERIYARAQIFFLIAIATLSTFFIVTGSIGLFRIAAAAQILEGAVSKNAATVAAAGGSLLDIVLGLAVLFRPWTVLAACGMIFLSAIYLIAGSIWAPALWSDPLGPFLKVFPVMILASGVALLAVER
jgi:hypothetical protein